MDNFYAYIPLILKYIVILPYFLKDSKQVLRQKIIKECNLNVSVETKKFINFSLNSFETINFEFTENLLIKAFKKRKYEPKLLFNLLINEKIQKLNHEIEQVKNEIELLKHSNSKNRNRA
ncbi:hypothetical protein [Spiroplasma ixodetis]|uniref:Uncharacterized protein n=1 Tax=Spiroplasma ixodetis TaxID=2141 RepID=A0ABM8BX12_9MOLU|nr:hypothetical protein [Spiroplasma ixodetis]BDT04417.1 hypothetical protein SHM_20630 [Spiroplasma ixodetis]